MNNQRADHGGSMSTAAVPGGGHRRSNLRRQLAALVSPSTWLDMAWLVFNLPIAIITFVLTVVGLSLSVGLTPLFLVGLGILAIVLTGARGMAAWERHKLRDWFGVEIAEPAPRPTGESFWKLFRRMVSSASTWRAVLLGIYRMPMMVGGVVIATAAWAAPIALLLFPVFGLGSADGSNVLFGIFASHLLASVVAVVLGLFLLPIAPYVARGVRVVDVAVATALVGPGKSEALSERIGELETTRARVMDAAALERQRIERDLHDGAQQRLVSVAMGLGMARQKYDDNPDEARALLEQSHAQAKEALTELRHLVRGIHPAVLTDRGLDAAFSGLAGQSPIPVTVDVELDSRPSRTIEAIAYFAVSEALANIAKHAKASHASVRARIDGDYLRITIADNGVGGAVASEGGGLAGLADRVAGVDGQFFVDSPKGGPTVITMELPCAS